MVSELQVLLPEPLEKTEALSEGLVQITLGRQTLDSNPGRVPAHLGPPKGRQTDVVLDAVGNSLPMVRSPRTWCCSRGCRE